MWSWNSTRSVIAALVLCAAGAANAQTTDEEAVGQALDRFHLLAAHADQAYFEAFTPDAVFIGTDPAERWTLPEMKAVFGPPFAQGRGFTYTPRKRHVSLTPDPCRCVAWFDEILDNQNVTFRSTGTVVKKAGRWLVMRYALSYALPNELGDEVSRRIQDYESKTSAAKPADSQSLVIVGATVIDGTGRPPQPNMAVTVRDGRVVSILPAGRQAPTGARVIEAKGKYLLPGFVDGNVHATPIVTDESAVRYYDRAEDLAVEFAQRSLKAGVTTVRDSYGLLGPGLRARDRIEKGELGARMVVAGNIIGWGGQYSVTSSWTRPDGLTLFQEQQNDLFSQNVGEDLIEMTPDEIRTQIRAYLDQGPDFLKYGGSSHENRPPLPIFTLEQQKAIIEEAHARGVPVDVHATSVETLRYALEAGVDYIQHADVLARDYPPALLRLVQEKKPFCGLVSNITTGAAWQEYLVAKAGADAEAARLGPPRTITERNRRFDSVGRFGRIVEFQRRNSAALIKAGCRIAISSDAMTFGAPEFARGPSKSDFANAGIGSLRAIEGLVELGMTPMDAIVAATANGAAAARVADLGTVEPGKLADLVILDANPLSDIRNIEKIHSVISRGRVVDIAKLPLNPVW